MHRWRSWHIRETQSLAERRILRPRGRTKRETICQWERRSMSNTNREWVELSPDLIQSWVSNSPIVLHRSLILSRSICSNLAIHYLNPWGFSVTHLKTAHTHIFPKFQSSRIRNLWISATGLRDQDSILFSHMAWRNHAFNPFRNSHEYTASQRRSCYVLPPYLVG